jgi:ribonuclease J
MNLLVIRHGSDCVVIDAGMMFPGAEHLGVDVVIPNLEFLDGCGTIHGLVLTHGHEDHIGAVPYLLARRDVPVYGTPYTLALVRERLEEHAMLRGPALRPISPDGGALRLGPFTIEALPVAHSIPQSRLLVVRTPCGTLVHTADFKLDAHPLDGEALDLRALSRLGDEGVLALLSDSTNADRPGVTAGERTVRPVLEQHVASAPARVFVTTFSSNVHRLQQVIDVAEAAGRKVAIVGSSMESHVEIAQRLGLLRLPAGLRLDPAVAMEHAPAEVLFLVTGSQGEPASALARIAVDGHRDVSIEDGDLVLHSARAIPGNDRSIGRMVNHLLRRGATVVTGADSPIHVSGHASRDELRLMIDLVRPKFLVPIHGEYRQLKAHAEIGRACGLPASRITLADSGDLLVLSEDSLEVAGRVPVGQVFIDGTLEEVGVALLKERRKIADDGLIVAVVAVDRENGTLNGDPEIASRGFVGLEGEEELLREARDVVADALASTSLEQRSDEGLLKEKLQTELKRFFRRRTQRRPLIVPVIVEL